jgi:hypothetical protein
MPHAHRHPLQTAVCAPGRRHAAGEHALMSFSDFFVASDADLDAHGVRADDPFGVNLWKLPCKPSVSTFCLPYDDVVRLIAHLARWSTDQVQEAMATLATVPGDFVVDELNGALTSALAAATPTVQGAEALVTADDWGREGSWDDVDHVNDVLQQLQALAAEAQRTGRHLCWWQVDSELLK